MVKNPSVFLMDEPLSNLDAKLRVQMRIELIESHKKLGTTFVYVTHDQIEAMSMADTIVLMNKGVIQQEAPPEVVYREPSNLFAAQFIGVPHEYCAAWGRSHDIRIPSGERRDRHRTGVVSLYDQGEVITREMLGSETIYQVRTTEGQAFMVKCQDDQFHVDQEVYLGVPADKLFFFGADENRIEAQDVRYREFMERLRGLAHG